MESAPEGEVSARADLVSALLWMAFGGAVTIGAWRMDRLERLNINKYEAPGLVPGLLGFAVLLLGVMLAVRAIRAGALAPAGRHDTSDWGRMAVVMAAMLGYSLLLVGPRSAVLAGHGGVRHRVHLLLRPRAADGAGPAALAPGSARSHLRRGDERHRFVRVPGNLLRQAALMFSGLIAFGHSLAGFLTFESIFFALVATLVGTLIGALPGLTATMGVALMTTLTLKLPSNIALLVLICTYVGAIYGGSRSAILLNIPGTPASAATCLDGFALARQGMAGRAMGIATSGSVLGTLVGVLCLALFTPVLGEMALKFGAYEFFWLAVFGVIISATLTGPDALKGWIAGFAGLFVATIGQDGIHAFERFNFGNRDLAGGISLVPALVGAFGFAEILVAMQERRPPMKVSSLDSVIPKVMDVLRYWRTIIRSGLIGTFMGLVPGVGEDVGAWSSYAAAKRASKEKEKFGKGSMEGLMAAETGNNAAVPGAIIPVLTLQVPGSAPAAVLMAAMLIHGVRPGPMIMIESPQFVYDIVAMILLATVGIFIYGLTLTKLLVKVLRVPTTIIVPIILVLCTIGTFALASRLFDIWVMVGFGVLGFILRRYGYPMAPLVLGIVLGDLLEKNFRRGLVLSDGDLLPFFTRPISAVLFGAIVLIIVLRLPPVRRLFSRKPAMETTV